METLSIQFAGTFELAQWCKLLRDRGHTGQQVARTLGRSEGYVNNLIRILERASVEVLTRWKTEQARETAGSMVPICATDWLMQVCVLPVDQQAAELARRIERFEGRGRANDPPKVNGESVHTQRGPTEPNREPVNGRRATTSEIEGEPANDGSPMIEDLQKQPG